MKPNNIPEFTVSEISRSIKILIEDSFGYVKVKGEISGFKEATSGHCYFSLKDDQALISAVCFRGTASKINFKIEDGLEVYLYGKVTTYEGRSNYQIIVSNIEIAGVGALMDMIEKRREKLLAEGLFDAKHKKPLPFWPDVIGVITSPTGAVIEDIIHRIRDRFPTNIKLYPASVQGKNAVLEIVAGIKYFNSLENEARPDVLIIARGGGSFEDLLPFSDEFLVREVFASQIPVISAVGHETDTTLIDYVSDVRAPTPTAAAEIATPLLSDLKNLVLSLEKRLKNYVENILAQKQKDLNNLTKNLIHPQKILEQNERGVKELAARMQFLVNNYLNDKAKDVKFLANSMKSPKQLLENHQNRISFLLNNLKRNFDSKIINAQNKVNFLGKSLKSPAQSLENHQNKILLLENNLKRNFDSRIANWENRVSLAAQLLESYHYKKVLKRGYAIVRSEQNKVVTDVSNLSDKQKINIEFDSGEVSAIVEKSELKSLKN